MSKYVSNTNRAVVDPMEVTTWTRQLWIQQWEIIKYHIQAVIDLIRVITLGYKYTP